MVSPRFGIACGLTINVLKLENFICVEKLNLLQLKVVELTDALESSGSYSKAEISERISKFRDKLMQVCTFPLQWCHNLNAKFPAVYSVYLK